MAMRRHNCPQGCDYFGDMMTFPRLKVGRCAFLLALLAMPLASYAQAPTAPTKAAPAAKAVAPAEKAAPPELTPRPAQADPAAKPAEPAPGGEEAAEAAGPDRSLERMKARIQELEARTDVAPDIRDQALAQLRTALGHLEAASASAATAKRFQESSQRSADRVTEAKQQLDALHKEPGEEEFAKRVDTLPLGEAQQALDASNSAAATIKSDLDQLEGRLREMGTRATAAREEQTVEKQALDALENADGAQSGDPNPVLIDAHRAAVGAERRARTAKLAVLEQELISLPARQTSATARRDLAAAKLEKLSKRIPIIEAHVNKLKEAEAAKRQAAADREARQTFRTPPSARSLREGHGGHPSARSRCGAASRRGEIQARRSPVGVCCASATVRSLHSRFSKSAVSGGSSASCCGRCAPSSRILRGLQRRIADRDQAIVDARLKRLQAEEARRALSDTGGMADKVLASYAKRGERAVTADVRPALEKLVAARRDLYVQLHDALVTRIAQLAELNATERDLLNQTTQLRALLNSRLLWLPSSRSIGIGWLDQVRTSFGWIVDLEAWKATAQTLIERAADLPFLTAFVLFIFGTLVAISRRLTARLARIAEAVGRYSTDNYLRTPEALLISVLLAVKTPVLFGYAGWLLVQPPQASDFAFGVGAGLLAMASLLLFLRLIQFISVENGLFAAHFGWSERARTTLYRNILWLKYVITPIAFILGMINVSSAQSLRDGLGRFAFLAGGIAVSLFIARVIDPRRGVFAERLTPTHPLWMTRVIWHVLISLLPLAIAGLALWGYYDGASQIRDGLLLSAAITVGAFLVYSVAMREVLVARRRLEIRRAMERREKARAQLAAQETSEASGEIPPAQVEEPEVDIASISDQTRQLVRLTVFLLLSAALYFFWREALPSLALLDVPLWQQLITVDGATRSIPVTVSNVMVALAIGVVTFIAARNLPGLLEITALHRLRIEAGTRYAISAVSRYLIAIVGLIFAFRSVGFDWNQVQWIVAALGVGVGFGLQEIVANFISGLIILFERPVRVGDTVTIGNLTGTVSRIHIRATSMTDGENREIIIPNKSLITEKVINWTLTDSITRVTLKIGIAYGTDTLRAQMAILEAVKATPQVLDAPAPSVFFIGFGASALEFEVRAFVLQLAHRSTVINDLHVAIERALREKEIAMS